MSCSLFLWFPLIFVLVVFKSFQSHFSNSLFKAIESFDISDSGSFLIRHRFRVCSWFGSRWQDWPAIWAFVNRLFAAFTAKRKPNKRPEKQNKQQQTHRVCFFIGYKFNLGCNHFVAEFARGLHWFAPFRRRFVHSNCRRNERWL